MKESNGKSVITLLLIIAIYSVLCLTTYRYERFTADTMLYVSIAQKYLAGDYQNAVNGYWGPLLAWLIVPFLYLGISDVLSLTLLYIVFGIMTFIGIWTLSFRFEIDGLTRKVILVASLPIILGFSLVQPMDFLLVCILIFYLSIIFRGDYYGSVKSALSCGFLGSMAYLTKAYAYPFFIVHFLGMNVFHYLADLSNDRGEKIIKNTVAGFIMFFLISGSWIMVISDKYGYVTFSTMRKTNFNAPGPEVKGGGLEFGVPVFTEGFFEPPNETAFVIWEDPSYLRGKPWSAWQSKAHFIHFIKLTLKNVAEGLKIFESFSSFSLIIIISYILLLIVNPFKSLFSKRDILYPLFTLALFSGGFLLFHFEPRYVWLSNVLLLLMGGQLIALLFQESFFKSKTRKYILIGFFIFSFIFVPSRFIMQTANSSVDREMYELSIELKKHNIKGRFASNRHSAGHAPWHNTFRLAYWLNSRYYGERAEKISDAELVGELKKYKIDYYFYWGTNDAVPSFLDDFQDVTNNEIQGLKVFLIHN